MNTSEMTIRATLRGMAITFGSDVSRLRTYAFAVLFVVGNIVAPQLAHMLPAGGPTLLPIYFFTLIAAYRYGLATGLVTAMMSPLINHLLFGMPAIEMLPVLLIKSALLAVSASFVSERMQGKVTILALLVVVLSYQLPGMFMELGLTGSWSLALQDIRIGYPGMLIQVLGGYAILYTMVKRKGFIVF
jgi:hypothetical protein